MIRHFRPFMLGLQLLVALQISAPAFGAASEPPPVQAAPSSPVAPVTPAAAPKPAAAVAPVEPVQRAEAPFSPAVVYGDTVLTEDTSWRGEVLVEGAVTVAPQATLTVEPGAVVRFRRKGSQAPLLVVQGRIIATGTRETPILFTSTFAKPAPGDWQGVMLLGSEKKNLLENCRIEGAQTALEALFSNVTLKGVLAERSGTGMRFQDSLVVMDGGAASGCDTGLSFAQSESTLRNISVVGNRLGLSAKRSSIYILEPNISGNRAAAFTADGCRIKFVGGALLGNGSGVTLMACEGTITGAKLAKSREYGISLTASRMRVAGNHIFGNGDGGLMVFDGSSVAWGNAIFENAGYDLYNAGTEEFRAPGNWWGTSPPKVFDNNGRGNVLYSPVLANKPVLQQAQ